MEEFDDTSSRVPEPAAKNKYLIFLCILTFIGSGFSALNYLFAPIYKKTIPAMGDVYAQMGDAAMQENMEKIMEYTMQVADCKFIIAGLTYVLAVVGAAFMLKMKPIGFHLYVISQLLTFACMNFLIKGPYTMHVIDVLFCACFVIFYYLQMKNVLTTQKSEDD